MEEVKMILEEAEQGMIKSMSHLSVELSKIRAGRANPSMLDAVKVDYYGSPTPLSQIGNVSTLDSRTLTIQPWEKSMLDEITKSVINANLGLNPQSNGEVIIISVPVLTEERRIELKKLIKSMGEKCKISIRNIRRDANEELKKLLKSKEIGEDQEKSFEKNVQLITDKHIVIVDEKISTKEKEIMTI